MCADKFRRTFPLKISFSDGEQPTAQKLTAIANQARTGSNLLEYAIGDVWNESGDSLLNDFELQIPNIARMIGQNQLVNPAIYHLKQTFEFHDNFGNTHGSGVHSGYLKYKPDGGTITSTSGGNIIGTPQTDPSLITENGNNLYFNSTDGELHIFHASGFAFNAIIVYNVDPSDWISGNEYLPSVIPDPRQATFTRCRLSTTGSRYYLHLPPRQPLTLDDNFERPDKYPSATDIADSDNLATVTGSPYKIFQSSASNALADAHYRYRFPKEIEDNLGSMANSTQLPYGLIYLWDHDTNSIVRDALFYKTISDTIYDTNDYQWIVEVSSVTAASDFATVASASGDETSASYSSPNARYSLICVGASLTNTLKVLSKLATGHKHDNTGDLSAIVNHNSLQYRDPKPDDMGQGFAPSRWTNDPHISLLSRAGSGNTRDLNDNAMLGNLVIASTSEDSPNSGNFLSTTGTSHSIRFGDNTGPQIYSNNNDLVLDDGTSTGNVGIKVSDPDRTLEVFGTVHVSTQDADFTNAPYGKGIELQVGDALQWIGSGSYYWGLTSVSSDFFLVHSTASDDSQDDVIPFRVEGGAPNNSLYIDSDGNVGLGVTPGDARLHIGTAESDTAGAGDLTFNAGSIELFTWRISADKGVLCLDRSWGVGTWYENALCIKRIDGRVGLGITAPDSLLHIHNATAGDVTAGGNTLLTLENNTNAYLSFLTTDSNTAGLIFGEGTTPDSNKASILYDHSSNLLRFLANNYGVDTLTIGNNVGTYTSHWIVDTNGLKIGHNSSNKDIQFQTNSDTKMWIASGGNVGIGTNPDNKLHILATLGDGIFVEDSSNDLAAPDIKIRGERFDANRSPCFSGKLVLEHLDSSGPMGSAFYGYLGTIIFGANHTNDLASNIAYPASIGAVAEGTYTNITTMPTGLVFCTGDVGRSNTTTANQLFGTERMRIDHDGNVGIGDFTGGSIPAKLTLTYTASSTPGTGDFEWNGLFSWRMGLHHANLALDRNFNNIWNQIITFDRSTGRVCIGDDTALSEPDSLLHIHNETAGTVTAAADTLLTLENNTDAYLSFLTPNTDSAGIYFGTISTGNKRGHIKYQHTNGVTDTLDFSINGRGDNYPVLRLSHSNSSSNYIGHWGLDIDGLKLGHNVAKDIQFQTNSDTKMWISSDGNVGIGVAPGGERLCIETTGSDTAGAGDLTFNAGTLGLFTWRIDQSNTILCLDRQWESGGEVWYENALCVRRGTGRIGIGINNPNSLLHVHNGDAGSVTAWGGTVLTLENNTHGYLSFLTPNTSKTGILFGTPDSNLRGWIVYRNTVDNTDTLDFMVNEHSDTSPVLRLSHTSGQNYAGHWSLDGTGLKIGHNSGSRDIQFQTSSNTKMWISSDGNVGIGVAPESAIRLKADGVIEASGDLQSTKYSTIEAVPAMYSLGVYRGDTSKTTSGAAYVRAGINTIPGGTLGLGDTILFKIEGWIETCPVAADIEEIGIYFYENSTYYYLDLVEAITTESVNDRIYADVWIQKIGTYWRHSVLGMYFSGPTNPRVQYGDTTIQANPVNDIEIGVYHYHNSISKTTVRWNAISYIVLGS